MTQRNDAGKAAVWVAAILTVLIMCWLADWYTALPIVDLSTATGECVGVDDPAHRYTCQTVPDWPTLTRWVP